MRDSKKANTYDEDFEDKTVPKISEAKRTEMKKEFKDRVSILCIAYHNLAVEQEFCKMYIPALESYKNAALFAYKYFGKDNALYHNMK